MALKLSKRHTEVSALTTKNYHPHFSRTQNFKLGVMGAMHLNNEEKSTGRLTEQTLQDIALNLKSEGYVILHEVMPHSWVTAMRSLFCAELEANYRDPPSQLASQNGHGGFQPPLKAPFLDPSIIENEIVFQILEYTLGEHFFGCLPYGCNTSFPGSTTQNVHRDCGHLFPELDLTLPPLLIVVNILLDEFTESNGATEIWPGSHRHIEADQAEISTLKIAPSRWSEHPSVRTTAPAGSIIIRDMRTWHRGMSNTTDALRTMLSLVYYRQHLLPDNLRSSDEVINEDDWQQLSERAKWIYRLWK